MYARRRHSNNISMLRVQRSSIPTVAHKVCSYSFVWFACFACRKRWLGHQWYLHFTALDNWYRSPLSCSAHTQRHQIFRITLALRANPAMWSKQQHNNSETSTDIVAKTPSSYMYIYIFLYIYIYTRKYIYNMYIIIYGPLHNTYSDHLRAYVFSYVFLYVEQTNEHMHIKFINMVDTSIPR